MLFYAVFLFLPCGWLYFFFCLDTKEEVTRRKNQGWTSPGLLRKGRSGAVKPNSLRFTTLRQGFPAPPVHSSAHAPPPRPVFISNGFFIRQGASLLAFCFWLRLWLSLYDFWGKICIHEILLENGLKKECEFLKTIRILQACNSHIADWLLECFFIFLVFFFIPSRRCCRAVFFWIIYGLYLTDRKSRFFLLSKSMRHLKTVNLAWLYSANQDTSLRISFYM